MFKRALKLHQLKDFDAAARLYNVLLNQAPDDQKLLFCLGDLYLRTKQTGLAANLLTALVQLYPNDADAWVNLGLAHRMEDRFEPAVMCWNRAIEIAGDTAAACNNMASLYADHAEPLKAMHWIERALKVDPNSVETQMQRGYCRLTLKDWTGGWDDYENRLKLDYFDTRASLNVPYWDWQPTEHLYVHGEQGIGDEIMFLSCLDEVLPLAKHVTLEVNKAVVNIAKQTWPGVNVISEVQPGNYTAKVAIGSLPTRLRRSADAFPGTPYLKPDPELVAHYRRAVEALGPGPYLAVAWQGGAGPTRSEDRSFSRTALEMWKGILTGYTCVSGQYEHNNPFIRMAREEVGIPLIDLQSAGKDMHNQAALFKAVDAVVSVQQTAVHVAGAVGAKTFVMVNAKPHWRYGLEGDLPWYRSVKLFRQQTLGDWTPVISQVENALADLKGLRRAQPADACAA